jgi:hypothetical protein
MKNTEEQRSRDTFHLRIKTTLISQFLAWNSSAQLSTNSAKHLLDQMSSLFFLKKRKKSYGNMYKVCVPVLACLSFFIQLSRGGGE